jgi:hypothetical protein
MGTGRSHNSPVGLDDAPSVDGSRGGKIGASGRGGNAKAVSPR